MRALESGLEIRVLQHQRLFADIGEGDAVVWIVLGEDILADSAGFPEVQTGVRILEDGSIAVRVQGGGERRGFEVWGRPDTDSVRDGESAKEKGAFPRVRPGMRVEGE